MHRLHLPVVLALLVPSAVPIEAQVYAEVEAAQIDSLGAGLIAEWRRMSAVTLQTPVSDATRTLNVLYFGSAREAMEINARLGFLETLNAESPENASLTAKLEGETAKLVRQSETLRNVVHDLAAGGTLDRLLIDLNQQATALERTIGGRAAGR